MPDVPSLADFESGLATTPADFTPATPAGLSAREAAQVDARTAQRTAPGATTLRQNLGEEAGTPLNIDDGLGIGVSYDLAQRRRPEDKIRYLAARYGAGNVRLNEAQEPIVRVTNPKTGQPMDVLVNARGLSMSDLGTVAGHYPELLGMMLGPAGLEAMGARLTTMTSKALAGAAGAAAGGAGMDVATRAADKASVEPAEIFMERGKNVVADTALQMGGAVVAKAATVGVQALSGQIPSPFKNLRGPIQNELADASERIFQRTGIQYEPTLGQSTGNPLIAGAEQYLESQPAGSAPIRAGIQRTERQKQAIQDFMVSPQTLPLDEAVGRKAIGALQGEAQAADAAVMAAKTAIQDDGQTAITDLLAQRFNRASAPPPQIIGAGMRDGATVQKAAFSTETEARYGLLDAHPLSQQAIIPTKPIANVAQKMYDALPRDPVTMDILTESITPGIIQRLERYRNWNTSKMPLGDVQALRKYLDQQIQGGKAITGLKDKELIQLRKGLTDTIEKGVKGTPLEPLWRDANDYYANNVTRFTDRNIDTLFRNPDQPNFVGDAAFLKSIVADTDKYTGVQNFFGRSSEEMRLLNRYIADKLMRDSLSSGFGEEIDAAALRTAMAQLHSSNPKIFFGVFGKRGEAILRHLNTLDAADALKGNISASDLTKALDPATLAEPNVARMLDAQRDAEKIYSNNIIKRFVKGEIGVEAIAGEDFVNKWLSNADLSDVKDVISKVRAADPVVAEQLGRKALQKFFTDASRAGTPAETLRGLRGDTTSLPSGVAMGEALKGDMGAKLEALLGKPQMDLLKDYVRVELAEDEKRRLAAGAGIMAKGTTIGSLLRLGVTGKEIGSYAKTKFLSYLISNPKFNKLISSNYQAKDIPDLARIIIASEPFAAAVAQDLKSDNNLLATIAELKNGVMKAQNSVLGGGRTTAQSQTQQSRQPQTLQEFEQGLPP